MGFDVLERRELRLVREGMTEEMVEGRALGSAEERVVERVGRVSVEGRVMVERRGWSEQGRSLRGGGERGRRGQCRSGGHTGGRYTSAW